MAYEKTNWKSGDVVTSAKLNNIEQGIDNANTFFVNISTNEGQSTLNPDGSAPAQSDKTFDEISNAISDGKNVVAVWNMLGAKIYLQIIQFMAGNVVSFGFNTVDIFSDELANIHQFGAFITSQDEVAIRQDTVPIELTKSS